MKPLRARRGRMLKASAEPAPDDLGPLVRRGHQRILIPPSLCQRRVTSGADHPLSLAVSFGCPDLRAGECAAVRRGLVLRQPSVFHLRIAGTLIFSGAIAWVQSRFRTGQASLALPGGLIWDPESGSS